VDIEAPRARISATEIANRFFCRREIEWLKRTPNGFLRLWTAKEAVIKAVGLGLSIPLTDFDVTDVVDGNATSVVVQTRGIDSRTIWLQELRLVENYAAAVAIEGPQHSVRVIAEE
jgi:4'-phosphopantetheinyl transferase